MDVYETISDPITERYGVYFSEMGEEKARNFLAGLCWYVISRKTSACRPENVLY